MKGKSIYELLENQVIGISISEPTNMAKHGVGRHHLDDIQVEIARHLLSYGGVLMYGGDLRDNGFTMNLLDLVSTYIPTSLDEERSSLLNYLGWPIDSTLTEDLQAKFAGRVDFEMPGLPSDCKGNYRAKSYLPPTKSRHYYLWSRSMTYMRTQMIERNDARVVIGGRLRGFKGKYPGIVEEIYLSLKLKKPVYLIGAYGGATSSVISALQGKEPFELTEEYQFVEPLPRDNAEYYNRNIGTADDTLSYKDLVNFFNECGLKSLNNGLTEEENKRLFKTSHIPEIVALIIRGLVSLKLT